MIQKPDENLNGRVDTRKRSVSDVLFEQLWSVLVLGTDERPETICSQASNLLHMVEPPTHLPSAGHEEARPCDSPKTVGSW